MYKKLTSIAAGILFVMSSCAVLRHGDMSQISLGMDKETVIKRIGKPNMVVSAQSTEEGPLEVYEYMPMSPNTYTETYEARPIWVYFLNGEVVEWGPGEDWQIDNAITKRMLEKYRHRKNNKW